MPRFDVFFSCDNAKINFLSYLFLSLLRIPTHTSARKVLSLSLSLFCSFSIVSWSAGARWMRTRHSSIRPEEASEQRERYYSLLLSYISLLPAKFSYSEEDRLTRFGTLSIIHPSHRGAELLRDVRVSHRSSRIRLLHSEETALRWTMLKRVQFIGTYRELSIDRITRFN